MRDSSLDVEVLDSQKPAVNCSNLSEDFLFQLQAPHKPGFDPCKNGDIGLAKRHRQAKRVRELKFAPATSEVCECCDLPLEAPLFPLCTGLKSLSELGPGFPMFFMNAKYLSLLFLFGAFCVGVPCCLANSLDNLRSPVWLQFSIGNANETEILPYWQSVLHVAFMGFLLLSYHLWRRFLAKQEWVMDMRTISPSDYTVMVTGLPLDTNEEEVRNYMQQFGRVDGKTAEVVRVTFARKIREFVDCIQALERMKNKLGVNGSTTWRCCFSRNRRLNALKHKSRVLTTRMQELELQLRSSGAPFTGTAFVTFRTQADARAVVARFGTSSLSWHFRVLVSRCFRRSSYTFRNHHIRAILAPEPSDIIWENLDSPFSERLKKSCATYLVTAIALAVSFLFIFMCSYHQHTINEHIGKDIPDDSFSSRLSSLWPALIVVGVNFVLGRAIRFFCAHESHHTYTGFNESVAFKLTAAQFLNTAVIALILNSQEDWFSPGGLVMDMVYIFVSNTLIQPLVCVLSPKFCLNWLKRVAAQHRAAVSQAELNETFEPPKLDMARTTARLMNTVLVTCCYAPLIPGAFAISFIGIGISYWGDKWALLRKHSRPEPLSGHLAEFMISTVPKSVMLYAGMNYYFTRALNPEESQVAFIWMLCVLSYLFVPVRQVVALIKRKKHEQYEFDFPGEAYEDVAVHFIEDYDRANPITQQEGWNRFIQLKACHDSQIPMSSPGVSGDIITGLRNYAQSRLQKVTGQPKASWLKGWASAYKVVPEVMGDLPNLMLFCRSDLSPNTPMNLDNRQVSPGMHGFWRSMYHSQAI